MTTALTIYGHPTSQPARAVYWACMLHEQRFKSGNGEEFDLNPGVVNPRGQIPAIDDDGFYLAEMPAILCYLAEKFGWQDLYPTGLQRRARIHQFLHMQHCLVRLATLKLMAPHVMKPLGMDTVSEGNPFSVGNSEWMISSFASPNPLQDGQKVVHTIASFLEQHYFNDASPYVCQTSQPSIADLACYEEIGQLHYAGLFDFGDYPRTQRWLEAMRGVPHHDSAHAYNIELGNICTTPNTMERIVKAVEAAYAALRSTVLVT